MDEARLWKLMNDARERMSLPQKRLWEMLQVDPVRWTCEPHGGINGGFWVVGLIGRNVIWFNDLEDGFQRSSYVRHGEIGEYGSMQFGLEEVVQHIQNELEAGHRTYPHSSGPIAGEFPLARK